MSGRLNLSDWITTLFLSLLIVIAINYGTSFLFLCGVLKNPIGYKIFSLLTVDFETGLPTFYNTVLIVLAFGLLAIISWRYVKLRSAGVYNWLLLTAAFFTLSLDESPAIHIYFRDIFFTYEPGREAIFTLAWIAPASIVVILFVFFLYRFINSLPSEIARGFLVAGTIYVAGAIFIDNFGIPFLHGRGYHTFRHVLTSSLEESLELIGLTLFIYHLVRYITIALPLDEQPAGSAYSTQ